MSDVLIHIRTLEWPVTEAEFAARFPRLKPPLERYYAAKGYAKVYHSTPPEYDAATQHLKEIAPERNLNGTWRQQWEVRYYTAEELVAREAEATRLAVQAAARQEIVAATIIGLTYRELDAYVDANVTDLVKARTYLKKLSRVVKALVERA